ncbi:MAG: hypothetical protein RCO49_04390 [Rickettsia endosymbiont of Argas persicus]
MDTRTLEEKLALLEPYINFIINNNHLIREIYPNGIDRNLMIEFISKALQVI